jgi:hypothetical protein
MVAVVAMLSLFVALVAVSSLRPEYSAASLPEPVAWTHRVDTAPTQASWVRFPDSGVRSAAQSAGHADHGPTSGCLPTHQKPFLSMWMTRDLPITEASSSSQPGWLALPASFAASKSPPATPIWANSSSVAALDDRDTLIQLCITRC